MPTTKLDLQNTIEELEKYKGRHTELITVYIPAGYDSIPVQRQLEAEKSTAKNIKSTATRKNVTDALDKIIRFLKESKTPENGVAVFSGNVAKSEGQNDLRLWSIEPPLPLKSRMYRCDKEFVLDDLRQMLEVDAIYGLLVMDRKEATIGMLEGKRIEVFKKMTSGVPSRVKAGGQSSQRFHRITEGLTKEFYNRIADEMKTIFYSNTRLKGILVGGPIPTKDEFLDGKYLATILQDKVIGRVDIGGSDESGLKELVERSKDILSNQEIIKEKKILERFFTYLGEKPGLVVYKVEDVKKAIEFGAVDTLVISEKADKALIKELKTKAESISSNIDFVSDETEEGKQFLHITKEGFGAILRFRYN